VRELPRYWTDEHETRLETVPIQHTREAAVCSPVRPARSFLALVTVPDRAATYKHECRTDDAPQSSDARRCDLRLLDLKTSRQRQPSDMRAAGRLLL
jgi:hypothetical protein